MASLELSTSRLPKEDSTDMDSNQIMRFHKLTLTVKSLHLFCLLSLHKCDRVYRRQNAKTFPWATTSRKGSSFAFSMKYSSYINLGRGGTRDLRIHQETNYTNTQKKMVGL